MIYKTHMFAHRLQKTTHALLSAAYLFLSLYAIPCAFHHDPGPQVGEHVHHADPGGAHSAAPEDDPDTGVHLACRAIQKIGGVALASAPVTLNAPDGIAFHLPHTAPPASSFTSYGPLSRGPPSLVSSS